MTDRVVQQTDGFANVWTYYDFHLGEELSHCGYDAFQLMVLDGQWRNLGVT
jgi:aryl carrier-like protein